MGLMESANSLMGHTIYEQRVLEKRAQLNENPALLGMAARVAAPIVAGAIGDKLSQKDEEVEMEEEGLDSIIDMERAGPDDEDEEGLEGLEGGEEEGEEELEMISVDDAIRAIQMIIDGDAETAEEAIEMVKAESGEEGGEEGEEGGEEGEEGLEGLEGLEGSDEEDEVDEKFVVAKPKVAPNRMQEKSKKFAFGKKEISEEDEEVVDECSGKGMKMNAKADQYGESHSMFLQFAERYLK